MKGPGPNRFRQAFAAVFEGGPPLILAHRGDSFHAPENTLEAAALGFLAGADGWEFDVRLTRDGVPIVIHDVGLLRTTDVATSFPGDPRAAHGYLVADFDLDEIRRLDAGSWFVDPCGGPRSAHAFGMLDRLDPSAVNIYRSGAVRLPTLDEALAFTVERGWMANVEIKSLDGGRAAALDAVLGTIRRREATTRVLLSSFDHPTVSAATRTTGLATGLLVETPADRPVNYVRSILGADAYHVPASALAPDSPFRSGLDDCRRAELPVLVYTLNPGQLTIKAGHLSGERVAGLFTDDPSGIKADVTPSGGRTSSRSDGVGHL